MSVIPLTIDTADRTVVDDAADFIISGRRIFIQDLDKARLKISHDNKNSNVCYDLRVGPRYRGYRAGRMTTLTLKKGQRLTIPPRSAVIIRTKERLRLPTTMYGIVTPKVTLLQKGISNTFSKVDPGYDGPLLVTLFNLGKIARRLEYEEPFCGLTILEVAQGATAYRKQWPEL